MNSSVVQTWMNSSDIILNCITEGNLQSSQAAKILMIITKGHETQVLSFPILPSFHPLYLSNNVVPAASQELDIVGRFETSIDSRHNHNLDGSYAPLKLDPCQV